MRFTFKTSATARRWMKFNAVGAAGIVVQTVTLAFLLRVAGLHYLVATALAVEAATLHNFAWHRKWTWSERPSARAATTLLRFNLTTGAASIIGNLIFMKLLVGEAGLSPGAANLVTIALCSLINFALSDRVVFV